jgi:HSP20 family protein
MARESAVKEREAGKGELAHRPFSALEPFREMERFFEDFARRPLWPRLIGEEFAAPAVDLYEKGNEVVLKAELPGMKKDDIEVDISDHMITISGEKKKEEKVETKDYYRLERSSGHFTRTFTLPENVEADKSKASFKDGVLEVHIPKSAEAQKKQKKLPIE